MCLVEGVQFFVPYLLLQVRLTKIMQLRKGKAMEVQDLAPAEGQKGYFVYYYWVGAQMSMKQQDECLTRMIEKGTDKWIQNAWIY